MPDERKTFQVEDAELIFKNFSGKEGRYNNAGDRNFCVLVDPETAEQLLQDGWNVRSLEPREEGDEPRPYVEVKVSYKQRPPRVVLISSTGRTALDESSVEVLDYADIRKVDLIANAYEWNVGGKSGIKAYLKTMFVTIEEDELERKYALMGQDEDE